MRTPSATISNSLDTRGHSGSGHCARRRRRDSSRRPLVAMIVSSSSMEATIRSPRRSGAALSSFSVGRVELLARGRWHRPPPVRRGTRVVAVGAAGIGIGQTTVAAHLAMATANLGAQVVAVDLAPAASAPSRTLSHLLAIEPPRLGWHALLDQE